MNFDETPIYIVGKTYAQKGSKEVLGKSDRSGWDKRQATLILYIFADGIPRISPTVIFHGTPTELGGQIEAAEGAQYAPGIIVQYNKTAYNNEDLTTGFITKQLIPLTGVTTENSLLLALDCAAFHKTASILEKLKANNVVTVMIPPGCTSILQPLDTHVNKPFKDYLREFTEAYVEAKESEQGDDQNSWSISQKRIMVTHVVKAAWDKLCTEPSKVELVKRSFKDIGLNLACDGSEDHILRIKGYQRNSLKVGDWTINDKEIEGYQSALLPEQLDGSFVFQADGDTRESPDYAGLTVAKLIDVFKARGIKGYSGKSKTYLVNILLTRDQELRADWTRIDEQTRLDAMDQHRHIEI